MTVMINNLFYKKNGYLLLILLFTILSPLAQAAGLPTTDLTKPILVTSDHPEFTLNLPANPSTGFTWYLTHIDNQLLQPIDQVYIKPNQSAKDEPRVGTGGSSVWRFKVLPAAFAVPTLTQLTFKYLRSWNLEQAEAQTLTILIQPTNHLSQPPSNTP